MDAKKVYITKEQHDQIKMLLDKGIEIKTIARIFGCGEHTVSRVKNGTHALSCKDKNPAYEHRNELEDIRSSVDAWTMQVHTMVKEMTKLIDHINGKEVSDSK